MCVLTVKNVQKSFGKIRVLKDISLAVQDGEIVSIIGASGSGKSTLLRCITKLETPDFGEIRKGKQDLCFRTLIFFHITVC